MAFMVSEWMLSKHKENLNMLSTLVNNFIHHPSVSMINWNFAEKNIFSFKALMMMQLKIWQTKKLWIKIFPKKVLKQAGFTYKKLKDCINDGNVNNGTFLHRLQFANIRPMFNPNLGEGIILPLFCLSLNESPLCNI